MYQELKKIFVKRDNIITIRVDLRQDMKSVSYFDMNTAAENNTSWACAGLDKIIFTVAAA